jgi:hypothetical protein
MKNTFIKIMTMPVLLGLLLSGCSLDEPDSPTGLEAPQPFASYVSLGNSLTAGYMDSGLMISGQMQSYPKIIAGQLGLGDGFSQPYVASPGIGSTNVGAGNIAGVLAYNEGTGAIAPLGITPAAEVQGLLLAMAQPTPYHNLGVPGATLQDEFSGYSSVNSESHSPFFDFINRPTLYGNEEQTAMLLGMDQQPYEATYQTASAGWQGVAKGPSLATMWIGNNDVLGGATGGNPSAANMTDPTVFAARYNETLQLLAGGLFNRTGFPATIIVANVPNVTDTAYFITEETFNQVLAAQTGGSVTSWPGGYEEGSAELLTFTVLSWVSANLANPATPVPSNYTLTATENATVQGYINGYNQAIAGVAQAVTASGYANVGLVDANTIVSELSAGQKTHFVLLVGQGLTTAQAAATTIFSLDGVHPNNHGYALVANAFIDKINEMLETEVATVDPTGYTWDPTYGAAGKGGVFTGLPTLSPEAAASMAAIWQ